MSQQILPIKVWGKGGPNPPKIAILLDELNLPYEINPIPFTDVKTPAYLAINPNGRLPSIQDPNSGITLWESGAILEYLIERYDTTHKLSFPQGTPEYHHAKQWLFFQVSGQGPYYGQAVWFKRFHSEKVQSAIERYTNEVNRVSAVLDGHLGKQKVKHGEAWLVGDKCSYADLAFITYQFIMNVMLEKEEYDVDKFPHVKDWLSRLTSRVAVKNVLDNTAPFNGKGPGE